MNHLRLSAPWYNYVHKIGVLFEGDTLLKLRFDENNLVLTIESIDNDGDKVAALLKLLPAEKTFGDITVKIKILGTPTDRVFRSNRELFEAAFKNNNAFGYCVCAADDGSYYFSGTYVVFKNTVVQFYCDNLADPRGIISTLYADIAAEVFADADVNTALGLYYCTDAVGRIHTPFIN